MGTNVRFASHPGDVVGLPTAELRRRFLVEDLFADGAVRWVLSHHDRILVGGAVPQGASLDLPAPPELSAASLCERRELGVVCLDGHGTVTADGETFELAAEDVLYVGQGTAAVSVSGPDAVFYLVSAPAHQRHPTTLARREEVEALSFGTVPDSNVRTIRKYVHQDGVASCELALGITTLEEGSVWNTMPCHTHHRRTEVYLYFGLSPEARVVHLCGEPTETRNILVADRQAVLSPPWSVHTGAGTAAYRFVWSTAGENLAWDDMDVVATTALR